MPCKDDSKEFHFPTPRTKPLISICVPHVRTRAGIGCRLRGLYNLKLAYAPFHILKPLSSCQFCSRARIAIPWPCWISIGIVFFVPGPLTLRIMLLVVSSMNSTLTWVTPPREPVRPKTRVTFTSLTGTLEESIFAIWNNARGFEVCGCWRLT